VVDVYVACPQQENGYDCGMFAAAIAKHLAHTHVTASSSSAASSSSSSSFASTTPPATATATTSPKPPQQRRRLDTSGLRARVTQDYIDELRRRLGKRVKELAAELGSPPTHPAAASASSS
jgi:Ulp1 family protease